MNWIDYREKLGIGFNDAQIFQAVKNGLIVFFDDLKSKLSITDLTDIGFQKYYLMVGEYPPRNYDSYCSIEAVEYSILSGDDLLDVISKYVAFINTAKDSFISPKMGDLLIHIMVETLNRYKIQFSIYKDDDGIFIFPKGVPEFDDALVSAPLDWLKDYPNAEKAWSKALRNYSVVTEDTASDVADLFRKALEAFFQEALGGSKSLENYMNEYGMFLKTHHVPAEIRHNLFTLLDAFTNYNNSYAKHHDKASLNVLEYLMYQTGNIIRLVITLQQEVTE